ncbi:MAG: cell division protein FtsZ [Bacteroidales bacterium]|nr:cell division protein FtsZ [Bacteroidales bacterium]
MAEEIINFDLPTNMSSIIKVIGVGGGGSNAVNYMYTRGIRDVNFIVCNTDAQALASSPVPVKIQLGESLTEGRGAGNKPEIGKQAAIENLNDVMNSLESNTKMVFITAGMGGGTGTGGAPVIAKATKELNILTVGIVTIPFRFEGQKRINQAIEGINELEKYVDSLLVINNEKLREIFGNLKISEAFSKADNVLASAAKGIAEIITVPGYINVDFADVNTVMADSGVAILGTGTASGENRAIEAIQEAITSPLLNNNDIKGSKNILLNITSGAEEVSMDEIGEITDYISSEVGSNVDIIWGIGHDEKLGDKISATIIATGFPSNSIPELYSKKVSMENYSLNDLNTKTKVETEFEIKDNDDSISFTDEPVLKQGVIEFNIEPNEPERYELFKNQSSNTIDSKKAAERIKKIKATQERIKEVNYKLSNKNDDIEELENIPAYKRKNRKIEDVKHSEKDEVSRYSLFDDENNNTELNTKNSYLHDNVD